MERTSARRGILLAVLAAALYAIGAPFSKLLLDVMPPMLMAGFLYLGAGIGMGFVFLARKLRVAGREEHPLTKKDLPYTAMMIVLDIAAPIFLLRGLRTASAANVSLLNNFEIVATALIALFAFKETISPRLWAGILFVTASCALLSLEDIGSLRFSGGSLLILLACICWGIENNCTRKLSAKDPLEIVLLKGLFSGSGSLVIGFAVGERLTVRWSIPAVLAVGLIAYGMSIYAYVYAQRLIGAARTGAYYAVAPFIGAGLSLLLFRGGTGKLFLPAFGCMALGAWLSSSDGPLFHKSRRCR